VPVSGTVVRINESLLKDTSLVNKDPYGQGWFFTLQLDDKNGTSLLNAEDYSKLIQPEA
jgi:glycine cleavage system H protein